MDKLDFLTDAPTGAETPAVDSAPAVEPAVEAPTRDANGRFAAPAAEPQPAPAAPTPEPQPEAKSEPTVPLKALQEVRDELKALKASQTQQSPQPAAEPAYIDPDVQNALLQERLNISEDLAVEKHGQEKVDAAKAWAIEKFKSNPAYQAEVLSQRNPYRRVLEDHKREQALQTFGDVDPDQFQAFKAWQAAQANPGSAPAAPAAAPAAVITSPPPPTSLASASSAGGPAVVPQGPGQAYDNAIK